MTDEEAKKAKENALSKIKSAYELNRWQLVLIDERVCHYVEDVIRDDIDIHCLQECLCVLKFFRLLDTYEFDLEAVWEVLNDAEGIWEKANGTWVYKEGGLKIDGLFGYRNYRLTQMQVFALAYMYGFKVWKDTGSVNGTRELIDSERNGENGTIEDKRRVIHHFVLMWPRKVAKTFMGAFVQFEGLMRGERDFEGYICANSASQSALLFKQLRGFVTQLNGWENYFRVTDSDQHRAIQWRPNTGRTGMVQALTAGGKTKDGLKACLCSADEFGAAQRVKQNCDMEGLINVVEGSMGTRRDPLTIHTSTAGLGNETPYEILIRNFEENLLKELDIELDGLPHETETDWQGGIILRPDQWEYDEKELRTERVIRKVNPNLGVTIQMDFYEKEWKAADLQGELKRKEVVTKLYNIFQSDKTKDWITADELRKLQGDETILNLKKNDWVAWCGMDFSKGDDLCSLGWVCVNVKTKQVFWDCTAWIAEDQLTKNTNAALYAEWVKQGWLRTSPGSTIDEQLVLSAIIEASQHVRLMQFGYDSYDSMRFVNAVQAWLCGKLKSRGLSTKAIEEELKLRLQPVSQTFATYNSACQVVWDDVHWKPRKLFISPNPLIPWCFSNAVLAESNDGNDNVKPVKKTANGKVDVCQTICTCYIQIGKFSV